MNENQPTEAHDTERKTPRDDLVGWRSHGWSEQELGLFSHALACAGSAIFVADVSRLDQPVIYGNSAMERLLAAGFDTIGELSVQSVQMPEVDHGRLSRIQFKDARLLAQLRQTAVERRGCVVMLGARAPTGDALWIELMLSPIRDGQDTVTHLIGVLTDRTEARKTEAECRDLYDRERSARLAAESAIRVREGFIGIASHELRTPLTALKGYLQILQRELRRPNPNRPRVDQATARLAQQVARFETLVGDLLDVSRIEQGRLELRLDEVDLTALSRRVVERFRRSLRAGSRHALVVVADAPVRGRWDGQRLDQLISNLVSNALKYSPSGGEVRVIVRSEKDHAELSVADHGVGMTPDQIGQLFQPFVRGPDQNLDSGGLGLGLYIASLIARQHGGSIRVESHPGQGSLFTVQLPFVAPSTIGNQASPA